jgi:hypothetical protein
MLEGRKLRRTALSDDMGTRRLSRIGAPAARPRVATNAKHRVTRGKRSRGKGISARFASEGSTSGQNEDDGACARDALTAPHRSYMRRSQLVTVMPS